MLLLRKNENVLSANVFSAWLASPLPLFNPQVTFYHSKTIDHCSYVNFIIHKKLSLCVSFFERCWFDRDLIKWVSLYFFSLCVVRTVSNKIPIVNHTWFAFVVFRNLVIVHDIHSSHDVSSSNGFFNSTIFLVASMVFNCPWPCVAE